MFSFLSKLFGNKKHCNNTTPSMDIIMKTRVVEPSIEETVKAQREQNKENKKILLRIEKALAVYPFIHDDKIKDFANCIVYGFRDKEVLTSAEKKELGLNTRRKYPKKLLSFFNISHFDFDPVDFYTRMLYTERSIVWALDELAKIRKSKIVKKVKLEGYGKWNNKIYSVDSVPDIETPDYTKHTGEGHILFFVTGKV